MYYKCCCNFIGRHILLNLSKMPRYTFPKNHQINRNRKLSKEQIEIRNLIREGDLLLSCPEKRRLFKLHKDNNDDIKDKLGRIFFKCGKRGMKEAPKGTNYYTTVNRVTARSLYKKAMKLKKLLRTKK